MPNLFKNSSGKKIKIYSTVKIPEHLIHIFGQHKDNVEINMNSGVLLERSELLRQVKGCDAVLCNALNRIDKELLDTAGHQLKVTHLNKFYMISYNKVI